MWTQLYSPRKLDDVLGQKEAIEKINIWFNKWKPGDKPLLLHGPPGSGKTCTVQALSNEKKFDLIEMNASDVRSAVQIKEVLGSSTMQQSLFKRGKIFLLDEIEGLSGKADFGGVKELIEIIKNSQHRIILTSNNPYDQKLRALRNYVEMVEFRKITVWDIEKDLKMIAGKENISIDKNVFTIISKISKGDLRSAITDFERVSYGKKEIGIKDVESLDFREREENIFEVIRSIFKTKNALAAKLSINNSDKDPDEIFWWIENNIVNEYEDPAEIACAFDLLSKADIFKKRISSQQNWSLKAYMIDLMTAGVALSKKDTYRKFTRYQYPANFIAMATNRERKIFRTEAFEKISSELHCSRKKLRSEYMPFLKIAFKNKKFKKSFAERFDLETADLKQLA